jgi:F-type H+-transporting ATPase subunit alpha
VGGAAQIKAMKKIAGPIRLELAQYRELAAFAQFGSDLDKDTLARLQQGERIVEILKQGQYQVLSVEKQIILLYIITNKYMSDINVEQIDTFEKEIIGYFELHGADILDEIRTTKDISKECEDKIKKMLDAYKSGAVERDEE